MIYYFNPSVEMAVRQNGLSYTPPATITQMESDLASIVMFLAKPDDYVVGEKPDAALVDMWRKIVVPPAFIDKRRAKVLIAKGEQFAPWGLSRAALHDFGLEERAKAWDWRALLSRATSVAIETEACRILGAPSPADPTLVSDFVALRAAIERRARNGGIVLKTLWSASGRGVRFFRADECDAALKFGEDVIGADGGLVIERRLQRVGEFSLLFYKENESVTYIGANAYRSAEQGGFGFEEIGPDALKEAQKANCEWERDVPSALSEAIGTVMKDSRYSGAIGIDAMVCEEPNGGLLIRCCTEANLRFCMGHVAHRVSKAFAPNTTARWGMVTFKKDGEWDHFAFSEAAKHPLVISQQGEIAGGFFRLSGLKESARFAMCGWAGEALSDSPFAK